MFLTLVKLGDNIIFYKMKAEPQARSTYSDIGRMTDLSENVGKCRNMSEYVGMVVGKCRKFDDFVGVTCGGGDLTMVEYRQGFLGGMGGLPPPS